MGKKPSNSFRYSCFQISISRDIKSRRSSSRRVSFAQTYEVKWVMCEGFICVYWFLKLQIFWGFLPSLPSYHLLSHDSLINFIFREFSKDDGWNEWEKANVSNSGIKTYLICFVFNHTVSINHCLISYVFILFVSNNLYCISRSKSRESRIPSKVVYRLLSVLLFIEYMVTLPPQHFPKTTHYIN